MECVAFRPEWVKARIAGNAACAKYSISVVYNNRLRMKPALIALLALTYALAHAAEWLSYGGDPQRSGWQRREKDLNTVSVRGLKLLWKRQLDNQSKGLNSLTAPTLLGPIFTHRGVKELVIIAGASDNVYAVDADLGRVFWKRHLDGTAPQDPHAEWPCGAGLTATPAIAPPASKIQNDDEASTPLRPIYVLSSDGRLHKIRPTDGEDMAPAVPFVAANANASSLNLVGRSIYTTTSGGCGGASNGFWSIDVSSPRPKASFSPSNDGSLPPVTFTWKGRKIRAAASREGRVFLLDGNSAASTTLTGSLATWEDRKGNRWIYAAGRSGIEAFMLSGEASRPELSRTRT